MTNNMLLLKIKEFLSKRYFLILSKTYTPIPENSLMKDIRNFRKVRNDFINKKNANLIFLLEQRYEWMNKYINKNDYGIEFGAGAAISEFFINSNNLIHSDYNDNEWLDLKNIDALNTPFENNSFDFVIISNTLHHIYSPISFLKEMHRILKPNGRLIMQETYASFFLCLMLKIMKHEGYSFEKNVFSENELFSDPYNSWSANTAISNLLFDDKGLFHEKISYFKIIEDKYSEFLTFLNSGGVNSKIFYIQLPRICLNILKSIDDILVIISPKIFALQRETVLQKK